MISTDLWRLVMTLCASVLACVDSLLESAPSCGLKRADPAMIAVQRNADRERVKARVKISGSRPHRVCARCLWKLRARVSLCCHAIMGSGFHSLAEQILCLGFRHQAHAQRINVIANVKIDANGCEIGLYIPVDIVCSPGLPPLVSSHQFAR